VFAGPGCTDAGVGVALLSFGDRHARQHEGETLAESGRRHLHVTTGSARPPEDAFRIAHTELVRWVQQLTGLSPMDAYQLVSQTALTPIANVVDTSYTVVAKMAKSHLRGVSVMGDSHRLLRGLG
jgi:acetamidase/formamidase